ncbi:MAG: hypothetical protein DMF03_08055 [Verrucomicrobia bacterium]|nr:MAG: hypothetical protein DMF03_08055 [Verrucomicrobiota bacterium]
MASKPRRISKVFTSLLNLCGALVHDLANDLASVLGELRMPQRSIISCDQVEKESRMDNAGAGCCARSFD